MKVQKSVNQKTSKKVIKQVELKYEKPTVSKIKGDIVLGSCCFVNTYKTQ